MVRKARANVAQQAAKSNNTTPSKFHLRGHPTRRHAVVLRTLPLPFCPSRRGKVMTVKSWLLVDCLRSLRRPLFLFRQSRAGKLPWEEGSVGSGQAACSRFPRCALRGRAEGAEGPSTDLDRCGGAHKKHGVGTSARHHRPHVRVRTPSSMARSSRGMLSKRERESFLMRVPRAGHRLCCLSQLIDQELGYGEQRDPPPRVHLHHGVVGARLVKVRRPRMYLSDRSASCAARSGVHRQSGASPARDTLEPRRSRRASRDADGRFIAPRDYLPSNH
ncbi:unnamed protein product [Scytosiphon promiscuus]